ENYAVSPYLKEKINSIQPLLKSWRKSGYPEDSINLLAMELLTSDLKPSRYHFISNLFKQEFPLHYSEYKKQGILVTKIIKYMDICKGAFDALHFSKSHCNSKRFKKAVTRIIRRQLFMDSYHRIISKT